MTFTEFESFNTFYQGSIVFLQNANIQTPQWTAVLKTKIQAIVISSCSSTDEYWTKWLSFTTFFYLLSFIRRRRYIPSPIVLTSARQTYWVFQNLTWNSSLLSLVDAKKPFSESRKTMNGREKRSEKWSKWSKNCPTLNNLKTGMIMDQMLTGPCVGVQRGKGAGSSCVACVRPHWNTRVKGVWGRFF